MLQLDYCSVIMHQYTSGIYVVIADLPETMAIQVGKRRKERFEKGFYAYVGSALSGLEKRLARHFGNRKRLHWHIDYLLNVAKVRAVVYAKTNRKKECLIAQLLSEKLASKLNFGCSDCDCSTHLFFCQDFNMLKERILNSFNLLDLTPSDIAP